MEYVYKAMHRIATRDFSQGAMFEVIEPLLLSPQVIPIL